MMIKMMKEEKEKNSWIRWIECIKSTKAVKLSWKSKFNSHFKCIKIKTKTLELFLNWMKKNWMESLLDVI